MTPISGVVLVDGLVAGHNAMLQELQSAGTPVAIISLRHEACDGNAPARACKPDGVLHLETMVFCLPAALRMTAAQLGVPYSSLLVLNINKDRNSHATSLSGLTGLHVLQGPRTALEVLRHIADSHRSSACAIVGVVMTDARWLDFQRRGFFPAVAQSRACFKRISASEALSGRGTCDIVLVKATDALLCLDDDGMPVFDEHMTQLLSTTYTPSCGVRLVECPISQHPVVNREAMAQLLANVADDLQTTNHGAAVPLSHKINLGLPVPIMEAQMRAAGLVPPVLLKSLTACGLEEAHCMALSFTLSSFKACVSSHFKGPIMAQQFVNHGGSVHKISVIGDQVHCGRRPSLPDLIPCKGASAPSEVFPFSSQGQASSLAQLANALQSGGCALPCRSGAEKDLHLETVHAAADALRARLASSLFGFDVLVESNTGTHYLVDLNYFPSYKHVPGAQEKLWSLCSKAAAERNGMG